MTLCRPGVGSEVKCQRACGTHGAPPVSGGVAGWMVRFQDGVMVSRRGVWPEIVLPHELASWNRANTGLTPNTARLSDAAYHVPLRDVG